MSSGISFYFYLRNSNLNDPPVRYTVGECWASGRRNVSNNHVWTGHLSGFEVFSPWCKTLPGLRRVIQRWEEKGQNPTACLFGSKYVMGQMAGYIEKGFLKPEKPVKEAIKNRLPATGGDAMLWHILSHSGMLSIMGEPIAENMQNVVQATEKFVRDWWPNVDRFSKELEVRRAVSGGRSYLTPYGTAVNKTVSEEVLALLRRYDEGESTLEMADRLQELYKYSK